jgi:hypothetical protein
VHFTSLDPSGISVGLKKPDMLMRRSFQVIRQQIHKLPPHSRCQSKPLQKNSTSSILEESGIIDRKHRQIGGTSHRGTHRSRGGWH